MLTKRTTANQSDFYVYQDAGAGFNHGFPSRFFGVTGKIDLHTGCIDDPTAPNGCSIDHNRLDRERGTVLRISFAPLVAGEFAGVEIEEPENWGVQARGHGYNLRGSTHLVLDARRTTPESIRVQFGLGLRRSEFIDVPSSWTTLKILTPFPIKLGDGHILFTVVTNGVNAPDGGTLLIDNIRFEPPPASYQSALSFPLSTQTFGIVLPKHPQPGRVSIPPDQIFRNLTTIYESALVAWALHIRGSEQDLQNLQLIAETFHYALHHDISGAPLPAAPDGSVGLHNGYMNGNIALFNDHKAGEGLAGEVRLAEFTATTELCGPTGSCLLLDGATGGNNAFSILALLAAYSRFHDEHYLNDARTIGKWIVHMLRDENPDSFGGYFLGFPNDGKSPRVLMKGKSTEDNADIFAAFTALATIEEHIGKDTNAAEWSKHATVAGDFVMKMFNPQTGCFFAGTVPVGTPGRSGIAPGGPQTGNDMINAFDFLDANTFATLALAATPGYRDQIDWRRPVRCVVDNFAQSITVKDTRFSGFNIVKTPTAGPNGIAWEFTGQAVVAMQFTDRLYGDSGFEGKKETYLEHIRQAQSKAPFGDGLGLVASTLQDGDRLPPGAQCLSTPFQCIPERVGLAATAWAIFADMGIDPLSAASTHVFVSP